MTTFNEILFIKENIEKDIKEEFRRNSIFIKVSLKDIFKSSFFKIPEYISINIYTCFKRLYSHSKVKKKSLFRFYLKLYKLESKADMSFNKLWHYYSKIKKGFSNITARNMYKVINYYIIDALCYQKLVIKCNVINKYREVTFITYVSFFDTYYHANRIKIRNLLGTYTTKCNMLFSIICHKDKKKGKYPKAYVFSSIKGIKNKQPITGLDFSSLYLSLIIAYNLSPEKLILSHKEADNMG